MKNVLIGLAVTLALMLGSNAVCAQNLIVNGGFESNGGPFTTPNNWTSNDFAAASGFDGITAHSGNFYLGMGAVGGDSSTSQVVSTALGQVYDLQFFLYADGGSPADINVYWNGVNVWSETNTNHGWVQHDILVTGTGSDTVNFGGRNDPTYNGVDDVSLFAVGVPEPATWALMAGVVIVSVGYVTRKRQAKLRMIEKSL